MKISNAALRSLEQVLPPESTSRDELMSKHTYFRLGGPADLFTVTRTSSQLIDAVIAADRRAVPRFILGAGSNILVGDLGIRGLVIKNESRNMRWGKASVLADSGVLVSELVAGAIYHELEGIEVFMSLPGTLGGAVYNNSHYRPEENEFIGNRIEQSMILLNQHVLSVRKPWFRFRYDYCRLHDVPAVVVAVTLKLTMTKNPKALRDVALALVKRRNQRQPIGEACSGCVFRNVEGLSASKLIDESGLKGRRVGGAEISKKHANFIINNGSAQVLDVVTLMDIVRDTVNATSGSFLNPEIFLVGDFSRQAQTIISSWQV